MLVVHACLCCTRLMHQLLAQTEKELRRTMGLLEAAEKGIHMTDKEIAACRQRIRRDAERIVTQEHKRLVRQLRDAVRVWLTTP